ncbi:hypothetical protein DFR58_12230 [Anaerobacterium chartisolvens]|uniref:Uncharacterized protein n=1 Tax=Anaerobacterium chartisolvens TaxID=1297424 RepID=A0A369ASX5_9FIRM|nr:hypothetical protein [Anaerobacterium chartisolvens]RCX12341.1 hypothetical protein DFR58_12230 [Anaerobacterium chartisolvens]
MNGVIKFLNEYPVFYVIIIIFSIALIYSAGKGIGSIIAELVYYVRH